MFGVVLLLLMYILLFPACRQELLDSQASEATVSGFALHITDTNTYVTKGQEKLASEVTNLTIVPPRDEASTNVSGTSFISKESLKIGEVKFKFKTTTHSYDCTLKNKNLLRRVVFDTYKLCEEIDLQVKNDERNEHKVDEIEENRQESNLGSDMQRYFSTHCVKSIARNTAASFKPIDKSIVISGKTYQADHSYRYQLDDRGTSDPNYYDVVLAGIASPEVVACMKQAKIFCSYNAQSLTRAVFIFGQGSKMISIVEASTSQAGLYVENNKLMADTVDKDGAKETIAISTCSR